MTHFADTASYQQVEIVRNETIARDTRLVRFYAPGMANEVVPGQFFMLRNPAGNDPLIGRAFALYETCADEGWVDLVYLVKGKLTTSISPLGAGDSLAVWGPLGNGFATPECNHLIMVAGGIGQTPFLSLAKEALGLQSFAGREVAPNESRKVTFCYGARTADYLAGVDQFLEVGCDVQLATEDGSSSPLAPTRHERVTESLRRILAESQPEGRQIVCCGPEPMMEAVAEIADEAQVPCQVSLETPMACGIGICFTCVAKVGTSDDWDYKRTCVEGPVFDSDQIIW